MAGLGKTVTRSNSGIGQNPIPDLPLSACAGGGRHVSYSSKAGNEVESIIFPSGQGAYIFRRLPDSRKAKRAFATKEPREGKRKPKNESATHVLVYSEMSKRPNGKTVEVMIAPAYEYERKIKKGENKGTKVHGVFARVGWSRWFAEENLGTGFVMNGKKADYILSKQSTKTADELGFFD